MPDHDTGSAASNHGPEKVRLTSHLFADRVGGYPIKRGEAVIDDTNRQQALRRLKIIAGQVQALQNQVEDDRYCMDVLDLSLSVQKALRSLDILILENHLRTCVKEQIEGGEIDRSVTELLRLYKVQGPASS